jgi:hypothetical protein
MKPEMRGKLEAFADPTIGNSKVLLGKDWHVSRLGMSERVNVGRALPTMIALLLRESFDINDSCAWFFPRPELNLSM